MLAQIVKVTQISVDTKNGIALGTCPKCNIVWTFHGYSWMDSFFKCKCGTRLYLPAICRIEC
jgi:hypothetical protein